MQNKTVAAAVFTVIFTIIAGLALSQPLVAQSTTPGRSFDVTMINCTGESQRHIFTEFSTTDPDLDLTPGVEDCPTALKATLALGYSVEHFQAAPGRSSDGPPAIHNTYTLVRRF